MQEEILILANSRKLNKRCVAGKTSDGKWIRLVSNSDGDGIPVREAEKIETLGIYRVKGLIHVVEEENPFHTENHVYTSTEYLGSVESEEQLKRFLDYPEYIFGIVDKKIYEDDVLDKEESLQFVKAKDIYIYYDNYGKLRMDFSYNKNRYRYIPVTVPNVEKRFSANGKNHTEEYEYGYLTVSLGVLYEGYSYLLASGLITVKN